MKTFKDKLLDTNDVTVGKIFLLVIILIVMYFYIFHFLLMPEVAGWNKLHDDTCFIRCDDPNAKKITGSLRGSNYLLLSDYDHSECLFTFWELTHMLFHVFLGYYFNIYVSVGLSVFFEIFEHYKYNCGSWLDLGWNFLGFMIGASLRSG